MPPGAADFARIPDVPGPSLPVAPERGPASLRVRYIYRRVNKLFLLFDIVDERKRNAGGVCPRGSDG